MGRKLFFSGIIIFISPGSPSQLVVGCIVAVLMMLISAYFMPYIGDTDDTLARVETCSASLGQLRTSTCRHCGATDSLALGTTHAPLSPPPNMLVRRLRLTSTRESCPLCRCRLPRAGDDRAL